MTRPAVIIGLGGTGQWVTTYVKKELLEDNGGSIPANVRLLCFDTWPDANVGGDEAIAKEVVSIGNTKLNLNTEFIPLSGDTFSKGTDIVEGRAPHLGKRISSRGDAYAWFDAPYFREKTPRATWHLAIGAGQIRQFGRMGFFNHATSIKQFLTRAFNAVNEANTSHQAVQVMIIASFAGGTGAGMFIDMATMARSLTNLLGAGGAVFRGIFVLPGAFTGNANTVAPEMRARAYAAWRELARFMNLGPDYGAHDIKYDNQSTTNVAEKPFDQVFLVDASRPQHSFTNIRPENGVFPSISTFISTALDDEAGQDLGNAVNQIQGLYDKNLGFSTFGSYSVQMPISHAINEYALQLERDLLKRWLTPQLGKKNGNEVVEGLLPDQNQEKSGTRGSQELKTFLTLPRHKLEAVVNRSDPSKPNPSVVYETNPVLAKIYALYESSTLGTYGRKVEEDSQGGYSRPGEDKKINSDSWLGKMLLPGDYDLTPVIGPDGRRINFDNNSIESEVNSTVRGKAPTSRDLSCDPTYDEADRIISTVENDRDGYLVSHYGVAGGRGSFDDELDQLSLFHTARFKQILEVELMNMLNGTVAEPFRGFSGRLGYAEDFCNSLFQVLQWYRTEHLRDVKTARGKAGLETQAKDILDGARSEMVANAGKKCLVFFNHPRAHNKQEQYIEDAQNYCEVMKDEKVIKILDKLTGSFQNMVAQVQAELEKWKLALILRSDSLYAQVIEQYTLTKDDLDNQEKVNKAQKLEVLRNYPTDYTQLPEVIVKIDQQMKLLRWSVDSSGALKIGCEVLTDEGFEPLVYGQDQHGHNKRLFTEVGRLAWKNFGQEHSLIDELGRNGGPNYRAPEQLGRELIAHSEPMFVSTIPGAGVKSAMRRACLTANNPNFNPANYVGKIDAINTEINPPISMDVGYMRSNSTNQHKLCMIQWIDRLSAEDFQVYNTLRTSYRQLIQGGASHETASRLHIFPAEGNAAFYEHHLPIWLGKSVRELSPRVVLLMTDVEKVRWFFQCYALGFIIHGRFKNNEGRWWRLVTPASADAQGQDICFFTSESDAEPDPFVLINSFCKGLDINNNSPIIWGEPGVEISGAVANGSVRRVLHQTIMNSNRTLKDRVDAQFASNLGISPAFTYAGININVDTPFRLIHYLESHGMALYDQYLKVYGAGQQTNPGWSWLRHEDYQDLAAVGRMMYIETLLTEGCITMSDLTDSAKAFYRG